MAGKVKQRLLSGVRLGSPHSYSGQEKGSGGDPQQKPRISRDSLSLRLACRENVGEVFSCLFLKKQLELTNMRLPAKATEREEAWQTAHGEGSGRAGTDMLTVWLSA